MDEQKKKKRVRLPLRAYLLYLLLVTFALTGVTFSRYVVSSDWGDGARVASIRQLTVTETGDVPAEGGKWLLAPGVDVTKNAVVALESSEVACYVFAEVQTGGWQRSGTHSYAIENAAAEAVCTAENAAVQWQILTEAGWVDIYGADDTALTVSYALVRETLSGAGDAYVRCRAEADGETAVSDPVCVTAAHAVPVTQAEVTAYETAQAQERAAQLAETAADAKRAARRARRSAHTSEYV